MDKVDGYLENKFWLDNIDDAWKDIKELWNGYSGWMVTYEIHIFECIMAMIHSRYNDYAQIQMILPSVQVKNQNV